MKTWIGTIAAACCALSMTAVADTADDVIAAYNDAVASGDPQARVRAAKDLGQLAIDQPDRPDAVILGFEAAHTLCVKARCDGATPIVRWLDGKSLPEDFVQSDLPLVIAYSDWMNDRNEETRQALDVAVTAVVEREPSVLSITALQTRYSTDLEAQAWAAARRAAGDAATHFANGGDMTRQHWSDARTSAIIALFNDAPRTSDATLQMAAHEADLKGLYSDYLQGGDAVEGDWRRKHYFRAMAWRHALAAYYESDHDANNEKRLKKQLVDILGEDATGKAGMIPASGDGDALPFCEGDYVRKPRLRFPKAAQRLGIFGAVLLEVTIEDGQITSAEPIASVPMARFADRVKRVVSKWSYEADEGVDLSTCTLSAEKTVVPVAFAFNNERSKY